MELVEKMDDLGKPAWIIAMILGFIIFWPIGLGILAYLIWSGRMACGKHKKAGRWHFDGTGARNGAFGRGRRGPTSGNRAFDEYREQTLQRLEDEYQEFKDFLEQLRHAKDKAEFDQFMAQRKNQVKTAEATELPDGDSPATA